MAGTGAFVGREGELSRLRLALAEQARLVLVVGDAGIGKTRFVDEGLRRATADGMLAVGGGCLPLAGKLPMLPVADALVELARLDGGRPFEAALTAARPYVRPELARLLPGLAADAPAADVPAEQWRHERLFAGVAEVLDGVARWSPLALLVEDVHWADAATLDFLIYLVRPRRDGAVSVVVTCRSDEVPLDAAVADWLMHVRRDAGLEEIRLGPLSRAEGTEQIARLVGTAPPADLVDVVYARAEGHPFFTEQLVAAAITDSGQLMQPVALPGRLAELLVARTSRCGTDARAVLAALSMAGRPLTESILGEVTSLDASTVRTAVQDLTAARLVATPAASGGHRPRHALLAEAVVGELLPAEQISLHEHIARALQATGDETFAAEAAEHWAAAGRSGDELYARLAAAEAAEHLFAFADAATHWQRAIELCQVVRNTDLGDGMDVPHLYMRAGDALDACGESGRAWAVAEEAYRRFADHPDPATAAQVHFRVAGFREVFDSAAAGLPLMKEALRLFEGTATAEHAQAWNVYAYAFLWHGGEGHREEILAALERALDVAEAAGAATLIPQILCDRALQSFLHEEVEEGFRLLARARSEPEASRDALSVLRIAVTESDVMLKTGKLEAATRVGLRGVAAVKRNGLEGHSRADALIVNAAEGLIGRGRTLEAAALIDPRTDGPFDPDHLALNEIRAELDLLRGEIEMAAQRLSQIRWGGGLEDARELGTRVAEVAVWAGRPDQALARVQSVLDRLKHTDWVILCGWLLAVGMRACADIAELARARRNDEALEAVLAAADHLASWVKRERDVPFTNHPYVATIPAARATWDAEHRRAMGKSDPAAWSVPAERWKALDYRHRAGYARWRQAEAVLTTPQGGRGAAATVLATAADLASEQVPLMSAIQDLARRARIDLSAASQTVQQDEPAATARAFGLTERELDVLRLLGQGKTNPEIAAALFISPRTAGVHVTHILRKLDATTRVQAATIADRAGLLGGLV
jgi:DNA-binding CsgD family transcriptional regulator/tetratricopeptide (TPR) repeat protein